MRRIVNAIFVLGLGQGVVLVCGIVTVKVLAVIAGPAAVGAFSLVRNLQQTVTPIGSLGGPTWIIQGLAVRAGRESEHGFLRAAWWIVITATLITLFFGFLLGPEDYLLDKGELGGVFSRATLNWTALAIAIGILLNFYRALLLAKLRTGKVTRVNAFVGIASAVLAFPVAQGINMGNFDWAAILLVISLGAGLISAMLYCRKVASFGHPITFMGAPAKAMVVMALKVALPTLAIYALGTVTIFLLRVLVTSQFGIGAAGIFDSAWTLSTLGIGLLLTTVSSYLLPATGIETSNRERVLLFEEALRIVTFIATPAIVLVICAKGLLVRLLYSADFLPATDLMRWMLIGEYFKTTGWLLATIAYARGHILAFAIVETMWSLVVLALSTMLTQTLGSMESFGVAYLGGYVLYTGAWLVYAARRGWLSFPASTAILWIGGLLLVSAVSFTTWNIPITDIMMNIAVVALTLLFCAIASRKSERIALFLLAKRVWHRSM